MSCNRWNKNEKNQYAFGWYKYAGSIRLTK